MRVVPKGFTCECDEFHLFSPYVYAHANDWLVFTCPKCQAKYQIRNYQAELVSHGTSGGIRPGDEE